jgi:hypothetical protein
VPAKEKGSGAFVSEEWLHHLVSQCHVLEYLSFGSLNVALENIKISSDTLKTLDLDVLAKVSEVEINAPKFEKFRFGALKISTILLNAPETLEVELAFYPDLHPDVYDDSWHSQLPKFLGYFNHFR